MTAGFVIPNPIFACPSLDGQNFIPAAPLFYVTRDGRILCAPQGGTTDGPSIPSWALSFIKPFGKKIWPGAIFHDAGYRGFLLVWSVEHGRFVAAYHNKAMNDAMFDEQMAVQGMSELERITVFESVNLGGESAYEDNLSKPLPDIVVPAGLPPMLLAD